MASGVIDASAMVAWLMPDEQGADLAEVIADGAAAPSVFWTETRNTLLVAERRGRVDAEWVDGVAAFLDASQIALDAGAETRTVIGLARRHDLTVYDAAYLELALRLHAPLWTIDKALHRAARGEGVPVPA